MLALMVGIEAPSARVVGVSVDLDGDASSGVREIDASDGCASGRRDDVLAYRIGKPTRADQPEHLRFEDALGRPVIVPLEDETA